MLTELNEKLDIDLLDKAVLITKDLSETDRKQLQDIVTKVTMSCGLFANCHLALEDLIKNSHVDANDLGIRFLEFIALGLVVGHLVATNSDTVSKVVLSEGAQKEVETHRQRMQKALTRDTTGTVN